MKADDARYDLTFAIAFSDSNHNTFIIAPVGNVITSARPSTPQVASVNAHGTDTTSLYGYRYVSFGK